MDRFVTYPQPLHIVCLDFVYNVLSRYMLKVGIVSFIRLYQFLSYLSSNLFRGFQWPASAACIQKVSGSRLAVGCFILQTDFRLLTCVVQSLAIILTVYSVPRLVAHREVPISVSVALVFSQ